jgi:pseudaminic acid synthase
MNIAVIPDMTKRFGKPVGLSDHSFGSLAPVVAVSMGAKVIEKHVCLNKEIESADSGFSMTMEEFAQMVKDVRNAQIIKGNVTYELTEHEKNGLGGRRSLVAVKPIAEGEEFTGENVRSIRPAIGIKPKYYHDLLGKKAKKAYRFGEPIVMDEIAYH